MYVSRSDIDVVTVAMVRSFVTVRVRSTVRVRVLVKCTAHTVQQSENKTDLSDIVYTAVYHIVEAAYDVHDVL